MLEKVTIHAFADDELRRGIGDYKVQINPETYTHTQRAEFTTDRGIDTAGSLSQFKSRAPETVSFDLVIDATGVVPGVTSLPAELDALRETVYTFNGDIHSPNYLKLVWGQFSFDCMLTSMDVAFELFSPDGVPLRARVALAFRQHQTPTDLARRAGKRSADLTHLRVTHEDSTLPLICHEIYDDPGLAPKVARANDLDTLMDLPLGLQLTCPPADS